MKRLTLALAFVLCLVLCVFAFASCGKKKAAATTAEQATAAATTAQATTAAETTAAPTLPPHVHTPEDHYTVDLKPTCTTPGEQSYYCEECGEKIPGTTVPIEIDPKAHKINGWTVTQPVDMFHVTGRREGFCTLCEETIVEELKFEPTIEAFICSSNTRSSGTNRSRISTPRQTPTSADVSKAANLCTTILPSRDVRPATRRSPARSSGWGTSRPPFRTTK